eukprot:scaffold97955_cov19-Tisochrysis_lutea.AAC.5
MCLHAGAQGRRSKADDMLLCDVFARRCPRTQVTSGQLAGTLPRRLPLAFGEHCSAQWSRGCMRGEVAQLFSDSLKKGHLAAGASAAAPRKGPQGPWGRPHMAAHQAVMLAVQLYLCVGLAGSTVLLNELAALRCVQVAACVVFNRLPVSIQLHNKASRNVRVSPVENAGLYCSSRVHTANTSWADIAQCTSHTDKFSGVKALKCPLGEDTCCGDGWVWLRQLRDAHPDEEEDEELQRVLEASKQDTQLRGGITRQMQQQQGATSEDEESIALTQG